MKRKPPPPSEPTITGEGIMDLLGVDRRTVQRWIEDGLPKKGEGWREAKIRWSDLVLWIYNRKPADGQDSPALERKRLADAIAAERRNALEEGRLQKTEDVRRDYRAIAHALRSQLETLARSWPQLEAELRAAFETAAKSLEAKAEGGEAA